MRYSELFAVVQESKKNHRRVAIASLGFLALLLAVGVCATATAATEGTRQARSGNIRAIAMTRVPAAYTREITRVQIYRQNVLVFDGPVPNRYRFTDFKIPSDLIQIVTLAPGREQQVLVRSYSGQNHCCYAAIVFDYNPSIQSYVKHMHVFGNMPYQVKRLSAEGYVRFVSFDDRFSYRFTSFAESRNPLFILAYRSGQFVDVTDCYPSLIRQDAASIWAAARKANPALPHEPRTDDLGAALAAWTADQYRLGAGNAALEKVRTFPRIQPNFVGDLTQFFQKTGYLKRNEPECSTATR